ncbi:UNVERIFIED_CONTAM: hypothetical protein FKN15_003201 [Acipenser sinensis]
MFLIKATPHLPSARTGPSDPAWDPSGSPNDPCHLPSALMRPNESARGPTCSANGPWHLPNAPTGPSDLCRVPAAHQMVPGASIVRPCPIDPARDTSGWPNGLCQLPSPRT